MRRLVAVVAPLVLVLASCTTSSNPTATVPIPPTATATATAMDPTESAERTGETPERAAGTIPGSGTFEVGADIEPGLYFSSAALSRGYWARLKGAPGDADDIIASGDPAATVYVQVAPKDKYFVSIGMEDWVLVDPDASGEKATRFAGTGMYQVGVDIKPGTYKASRVRGDAAYWHRYRGASGGDDDLIDDDNPQGSTVVRIRASDGFFDTHGMTEWVASSEPASCPGDRPLEPGAQVISNDEVSLTITTQECMSRNWEGPGDDFFGEFGKLLLSAPDQVADLSETVSQDGQRSGKYITAGEFLAAGLIEVPSDIGAWLDGAASLTVLDEGTTSLAGGEASWWQVEVSDPKAQCWTTPEEADEGCVLLWPSNIMPLGGVSVHTDELTARIYAIDTTFDTSAQRHRIRRPSDPEGGTVFALSVSDSDTAQENEAEWRASTDKMISTITFEPCQGSCNGTTDQTG